MPRAHRHHDDDLPLFGYRKSAEVILFPSARRVDLVERIATHMASLPPERADRYLEIALGALADKHRACGIAARKARVDIDALGNAVLDTYEAIAAEEVV